jgi:amino acid transporter
VLFAFMLIVPFSNGFPDLGRLDRNIFFVGFIATALSIAFLIAPSAYHRIRWRQHDKERMLIASNYLSIAGLIALAVAITCTVFVITDFIFDGTLAATFTALIAATLLVLWYGLPLAALLRDWQQSRRAR